MTKFSPDQPHDGSPTAAEIFSVFRNTTMASIEGLRLLLTECADLRAELVAIHNLRSDGQGDGVFSVRQKTRILELRWKLCWSLCPTKSTKQHVNLR